MDLRSNKAKLLIGMALLLFVSGFWAIFCRQSPGLVRLTFLYRTNDATGGNEAVFQLVNGLNEIVECGSGLYQAASKSDVEPQRGDWSASIPVYNKFAAHSTNTV